MPIEGVTVQKIIEPKLLGVFKAHNVYLCHGKYGEYLRHNSVNYSIPEWAKMENLNEPFGIAQASNIIDWKMRNKVPRGEAVCKELDDKILGEFNGQTVTLMFRDHGHCRFLRYNNENYYLDKSKNLDNFTLDDAVKKFHWDRKKKYPSMYLKMNAPGIQQIH
jgi:hypothetical protein